MSKTILDYFKEVAETHADKVAIQHNLQKITYCELDRESSVLAQYLLSRGCKQGNHVGLYFERSIEFIVAVLACMKIGVVFIPISTDNARARIQLMQGIANIKFIVTLSRLTEAVCINGVELIFFDNKIDEQKNKSSKFFVSCDPHKTLCIMFTSGTTGEPKGVMVDHSGVLRLVISPGYINITADDVIAHSSNISFDAINFEIWAALLNGGMLVIVDKEIFISTRCYAKFLKDNGVTVQFITTALFNLHVKVNSGCFNGLRYLLFGGESADANVLMNYLSNKSHLPQNLLNMYGPTECTTFATYCKLNEDVISEGVVPIGVPINETDIFIVKEDCGVTKQCAVGEVGEVIIGGSGVSSGYVGRSRLTQESFVFFPFCNEICYRTGDLGFINRMGQLIFCSRKDRQFKINGYRVEPSEIECVIRKHETVDQCCILLEKNAVTNARIVAYITLNGSPMSSEQLNMFLDDNLPTYMKPQCVRIVESIPLNSNGKTNYQDLSKIDYYTLGDHDKSFSTPCTEIENFISIKICELLDVNILDIDISIFDLGMSSLLVSQLCNSIIDKYSVLPPVSMVFKLKTIRKIASYVGELRAREHADIPEIIKCRYKSSVPVSPSQRRLWLLSRLHGGNSNYNAPIIYRVTGVLDTSRFENCIKLMISRHQSLRSIIVDHEGVPYLQILDQFQFSVRVHHVSCDKVNDMVDDVITRNFEYDKFPLFTIDIFILTKSNYVILFNFSHIIMDGWSLELFFNELSSIYNNDFQEFTSEFEFSDYSYWASRLLNTDFISDQRKYWMESLGSFQKSSSYDALVINDNSAGLNKLNLNKSIWETLKKYSRDNEFTLATILCATYIMTIARYYSRDDIVIGMPVSNRRLTQMDSIIGFFANTVAIRVDLKSVSTNVDYLKLVGDTIFNAIDNQDLPYDEVVSMVRNKRDIYSGGLFTCMFVMQNNRKYELKLRGYDCEELQERKRLAKFELLLSAFEDVNGFTIELEWSKSRFNQVEADKFFDIYEDILYKLIAPQRVDLTSILVGEDYQLEYIKPGNQLALSMHPFQVMLKKAVCEYYNDAALIDKGIVITYKQLHELSNKVGWFLIEHGVAEGDVLAVYSDKSSLSIAIFIACIKLNLTYMSLDVQYPEKYLNEILDVAKPKYVMNFSDTYISKINCYITLSLNVNELDDFESKDLPTNNKARCPTYVVFTSGSTGRPKGICITDDIILNLIEFQNDKLSFKSRARTLQYSSMNFDVSIQEILTTLCYGGVLLLPDIETRNDSILLLKFLIDFNIERLFLPFAKLQDIASAAVSLNLYPNTIKELISTGEQLITTDQIRLFYNMQDECRLFNMYGPSETHVVCVYEMSQNANLWNCNPPIGKQIDNVTIEIVSENGICSPNTIGEIYIGGLVSRYCYISDDQVDSYKSLRVNDRIERYYKSGDVGFKNEDGDIVFCGRRDAQVKISGNRVDLHYLESVILKHNNISAAAVDVNFVHNVGYLHAYIATSCFVSPKDLMESLRLSLPAYMLPTKITRVSNLPLTLSGKLDRKKLKLVANSGITDVSNDMPSENDILRQLVAIFEKYFPAESIKTETNFFDIGATSLLLSQIHVLIYKSITDKVKLLDLFLYPTICKLADYITIVKKNTSSAIDGHQKNSVVDELSDNHSIAVIGMSAKFPGASNVGEFWENTINMKKSTFMINPDDVDCGSISSSGHVRSVSSMSGIYEFDPGYFGISEKEALIMDPQHRHFLMGAVDALNSTKYDYREFNGKIGVVGSCAENTYSASLLKSQYQLKNNISDFQWAISSEKDFIATRASYYLNLRGPAYTIQSACSSSLVAIHVACSQLWNADSDMVLVGGVAIDCEILNGYNYTEGHIYSPDGFCRPFDIKSNGTYAGNGYGFIVLKKLNDAIRDGDIVYGVIEGSSINNDGREKVGFTAPSVLGQADVIRAALKNANITADKIEYIEAHGTATQLGDAVEVSALKKAFEGLGVSDKSCAIVSLKSQIGHLAAAAGISGFIRTVLALYHEKVPANINFTALNENIQLSESPFYINTKFKDWSTTTKIKYAGISSFGIGGTNAHVILSDRGVSRVDDQRVNKMMCPLSVFSTREYNAKDLLEKTHKPKRKKLGRWFYKPTWTRLARPKALDIEVANLCTNYVIFLDNNGVGMEVAKYLMAMNCSVVTVSCGDEFVADNHQYVINPKSNQDYSNLLNSIKSKYCSFSLVFFSSICNLDTTIENLGLYKDMSLYVLLHFIQAYDNTYGGIKLKIITISRGLFSVTGEENLYPIPSLIVGAGRVLSLELESVEFSHIDFYDQGGEQISTEVMNDLKVAILNSDRNPKILSLRKSHYWKFSVIPVMADEFNRDSQLISKDNGVYVIIGGTGEIGSQIAKFISEISRCHIILISRNGFDAENDSHITMAQLIKKNGSTVEFIKCDISELESLKRVFEYVKLVYKKIDGVVHSAGVADGCLSLKKRYSDSELVIKPKVDALIIMERLVDIASLDFFVVFSSVAGYTGEIGQFSYCAANAFQDSYVEYISNKYTGTKVFSIAWDTWRDGGMAVNNLAESNVRKFQESEIANGITREEGRRVFNLSFKANLTNIIISTVSYSRRGKLHAISKTDASINVEFNEDRLSIIIKVFVKYLGGIATKNSNFFDLGGDSLTAIEMISAINKYLNVKLSVGNLLSNPTPNLLLKFMEAVDFDKHVIDGEVVMQNGTNTKIVFLIHPIGGGIYCYKELVDALPKDMKIVAIQDPALLKTNIVFLSLQEKIEFYIRIIRKHQPVGPCYMVGWSFGALMAHQISRQLEVDGAIGHYVFMIDPPSPRTFTDMKSINVLSNADRELELDGFGCEAGTISHSERHALVQKVVNSNISLMNSHQVNKSHSSSQFVFLANEHGNVARISEWSVYCSESMRSYNVIGDHYSILKQPALGSITKVINHYLELRSNLTYGVS